MRFHSESDEITISDDLYLVSFIEFKFVSARTFRFFGAGDLKIEKYCPGLDVPISSEAVGFCSSAP